MPGRHRTSRLIAACISLCLLGALFVLGGPSADATGGTLVWGVNPFDNGSVGDHRGLQAFDTSTGENIGGAQITVVGGTVPGTVIGATGLAVDPTTGTAYTLLRMGNFESPRVLATIDLTNGHATTLYDTAMKLSSITFDAAGTLYAVTGRGNDSSVPNPCQGCLYTLGKTTLATTLLKQLSNCPGLTSSSSCGHGIAYNADDGLIYHTSGDVTHPTLEKVSLTPPYTITNVGYDAGGVTPDTAYGIGFDATLHRFVITDWNRHVYNVSVPPSGPAVATQLPDDTRLYLKGLYVSPDPVPTDNPPTAVDDAATTNEGQYVTFPITDNDTDADAGTEFVDSYTQPAHGRVTFNSSASNNNGLDYSSFPQQATYTPNSGYCNDGSPTDDFTYTLNGGSTATVRVTVNCVPFTGPLVFGVDRYDNGDQSGHGGLVAFDAGTGIVQLDKPVTAVFGSQITGDIEGVPALAVNPKNDVAYAVVQMSTDNSFVLATIDTLTGDAVTIGDIGFSIVGLTFGSNGTLYGVTDNNDPTCPDCLFKISTSTGAGKKIRSLPNPDGYETIAFNPRDGNIYRATAGNFEFYDPRNSFKIHSIGYGGLEPGAPYGLGFDPATGGFWMTDYENVEQLATNGGLTAPVSAITDGRDFSGLAVADPMLSLKYSSTQHKASGKLLTPALHGCDAGRSVSIFKDATVPVLVDTVTTDANGVYTRPGKLGGGHYYATVSAGPDDAGLPCAGGRSKTITVR
jgi:hypothetical protein